MKYKILPLLFWLFPLLAWSQKPELMVQRGHSSSVQAVAFSPDGQYLVTGGREGMVKLWNISGQELRTFTAIDLKYVSSVAFSPNGEWVLAGAKDGIAVLWDLSGKEIRKFAGHDGYVTSVAFSRDGKYVLTGSTDGKAKRWEVTGRELQTYNVAKSIHQVAYLPDGKHILTADRDGSAQLWLVETSETELRRFQQASDGASISVAFSPDGKFVLTGGGSDKEKPEYNAKLWSLSGELLQTVRGHKSEVSTVAFSPDGKNILTGDKDAILKLCDLSGQELQSFSGHKAMINDVAFSPDGRFILSGSTDQTAKLWSLSKGETRTFQKSLLPIYTLDRASDGRSLLVNSGLDEAMLWGLAGQPVRRFSKHTHRVTQVAHSPDGKYILAAGRLDKELRDSLLKGEEKKTMNIATLWQIEDETKQNLVYRDRRISALAFSPDGKQFVLGDRRNGIELWNTSGHLIHSFNEGSEGVGSLAFSPDGQVILSSSGNDSLKFWNSNGQLNQTFVAGKSPEQELPDQLAAAIFSPDGKWVVAAGKHSVLRLWDREGRELWSAPAHTNFVEALAFSPDSKYILTGGYDGRIKLWDLNGREVQRFVGHSNFVKGVAFSLDGQQAYSVSIDGILKIWEIHSGSLLADLYDFGPEQGWAVVTPDGRFDGDHSGLENLHYVAGLETISLNLLKERYWEPGLLAKVTGFSDQPMRKIKNLDQLELYPKSDLQLQGDVLHVSLEARNGGIGRVALYVGHKEVDADINPQRQSTLTVDLRKFANFFTPDTTVSIGVKVWNADDWLVSKLIQLDYKPTFGELKINASPRLFAISIGTSDYQGEDLDLAFADQDSKIIAQTIRDAGGQFLSGEPGLVYVQVLNTSTESQQWPSKDNIRRAMQQIAEKTKPEDVFVLYLAGHGTTIDRDGRDYFYYLTHDLNSGNIDASDLQQQYAISTAEFADWLTAIPAQKQVLILDACASGIFNASMNDLLARRDVPASQIRALDRLRSRTGLFILSGSTADQVSYEASPFGQGLLTYCLLHGIKSGEALRDDQYLDVQSLFSYAKELVPDLARQIGGVQEPTIFSPYGAESYDIGRATQEVRNNIPLSEPKPVFSRVRLSDQLTYNDDLKLENIVNEQLRDFSKMGMDAVLIFVNVNEDPNAYRIIGSYSLEGDVISFKGRVARDGEQVGDSFELSGQKSDLPAFGKKVIARAYEAIK